MDASIQWSMVNLKYISLVVIFGDYLGLGILLKLIIDGKLVFGVDLNKWALELFFFFSYWKKLRELFRLEICISLKNLIFFVIWLFLNYG